MGVLWETSAWEFVILTLFLGGLTAAMSGRAVARNWGSLLELAVYVLLLGAALRFLHFALYQGTLRSFYFYAVDTTWLALVALLAHRLTRVKQMVTQYGWLCRRIGPFGWRATANTDDGARTA